MSGSNKIKKPFEKFEKNNEALPAKVDATTKGIAGNLSFEKDNKKFLKLANEKVYMNPDKGSFIVLGRDRTGIALNKNSGMPNTNSIDIVVGRLAKISEMIDKQKEKVWISPDFLNDAARIHISQFTNVDENFSLPAGKTGFSKEESAIGIKADSVRMISRTGGIKLISGHDKKDSNGFSKPTIKGVELIAGIPYDPSNQALNMKHELKMYKHDMQAIPKTDNLREALNYLTDCLDRITGILINFASIQLEFNQFLVNHTHIETFLGNQGIPSKDLYGPFLEMNMSFWETTLQDVKEFKTKSIPNFKETYLSPISDLYIGSRFHFLN